MLLTAVISFSFLVLELCIVWIIVIIFLLILSWLLFAPLELQVDTRTPQASFRWISIGKAIVTYEKDKWWLRIRVLFFYKQWEFEKLILAKKKKKKKSKRIKKQRKPGARKLRKFLNLIASFHVIRWQIAVDTGDGLQNAYLYTLNFLPQTRNHLYINFLEQNYLALKIRNTPWKLLYAFVK